MINLSHFVNSSSWNIINKDPCSWKGVTCNSDNSSVTKISLSGFGLSNNTVVSVSCRINTLESLDVSKNNFDAIPNDFIQVCGKIDGLKLVNFSGNHLVGSLPAFDGFVALQFLDLSFNGMDGKVSLQLNELVSLKSLNLSNNHFSGSIPINLGKNMALEQLQLSFNLFDGSIPLEFANYGNLTILDLSVNRIHGSIPDRIGELAKLEILVLSSNNLTGIIPSSLVKIKTLSRFAANQNGFAGSIPGGITESLKNLDLSYNWLSGSIPSDLWSRPNLQSIDLSNNLLDGSFPGNMSSSLIRLRLINNSFNGDLPRSTFTNLENLMYLELDGNNFTGSIPSELGFCYKLALLSLAQNSLTGSMPTELGNLTNLQVLKLQSNKLIGSIPGEITDLRNLLVLNISWNSLNGSIPSSISRLQSLTNLYLQGNNFSGSIPETVGEMKSLLEFQVGENRLSGRLPRMPHTLQIALNLSGNLFKGMIPTIFSELNSLEVLDLSDNKFSGKIPDFLTKWPALTQLILSNNQLSGAIPAFKNYVLVDITGNPGLFKVPTADSPPGSTKKKKSVVLPVVIALSSAFLVVLMGAAIALSLMRYFSRVSDSHSESAENTSPPQVIQGKLLTTNSIHKSNIHFNKAMEVVVDPLKAVLITRFSTYYKTGTTSRVSYFIKKLNWSNNVLQLDGPEKFERELEVLGKLNNPNVMTPLAYVLTVDSAFLFYEYTEKGTLHDALHVSGLNNVVDWASRYTIAVGVAQGLAFLHGCASGPVLLLDLSSKNIFLKSLMEPVVGDIELCKLIDPSKSTSSLSAVAGSVGYIPPEYAYTMRITLAGNVYSFGVILLELLTGRRAVGDRIELAKWALNYSVNYNRLDRILDPKVSITSVAVRSQMLAVMKIALACVNASPEARPKTKSLLRMLLDARVR
ncbi:hypothetical protein ACFE04_007110 [Oxalis oulophora]